MMEPQIKHEPLKNKVELGFGYVFKYNPPKITPSSGKEWITLGFSGSDVIGALIQCDDDTNLPFWIMSATIWPSFVGDVTRIMSFDDVIEAYKRGKTIIRQTVSEDTITDLTRSSKQPPRSILRI